jgi:hypothetical protein
MTLDPEVAGAGAMPTRSVPLVDRFSFKIKHQVSGLLKPQKAAVEQLKRPRLAVDAAETSGLATTLETHSDTVTWRSRGFSQNVIAEIRK